MNLFEILQPRTSAWIVESLAHVLWQGCLLAGLAAVVAQGLRKCTAQSRYLLFCSALFATAACLPLNLWMMNPADPIVLPTVSSEGRRVASIGVDGYGNTPGETDVSPRKGQLDQDTLLPGPALKDSAERSEFRWIMASRLIVAAYALGIVVMSLRLLMGLYGSQRLRATATPVEDSFVQDALARIGERYRLSVLPVVAYSARVATPLVVGVLKPAILLPTAILSQLTPEQVESLLLHEMAHIRRYDHVVNLLQRIVETALFFHPAIWWLSHNVSVEREHCCDDLAIAWGSERCNYAESLVRISELRLQAAGTGFESGAALAATGGKPTRLHGRVLRVLGMPLPGPNPGVTRRGLALVLALVISVAALVSSRAEGDGPGSATEAARTANSDGVAAGENEATTRTRHFVRVVSGNATVAVDGELVLREQLEQRLLQVPDREHTVLEYAQTSDSNLDLDLELYKLAIQLGFEYFSSTGVHPLSATGSPDKQVPRDVEEEQRIAQFIRQIIRQPETDRVQVISIQDRQVSVNGLVLPEDHALSVLRAIPNRRAKVLEVSLAPRRISPKEDLPSLLLFAEAFSSAESQQKIWKLIGEALGFKAVEFTDTSRGDKHPAVSVAKTWLQLVQDNKYEEADKLADPDRFRETHDVRDSDLLQGIELQEKYIRDNAVVIVSDKKQREGESGSVVFRIERDPRVESGWIVRDVDFVGEDDLKQQIAAFTAPVIVNQVNELTLKASENSLLDLETGRMIRVDDDWEKKTDDPLKWLAVRGCDLTISRNPQKHDEINGVGVLAQIVRVDGALWENASSRDIDQALIDVPLKGVVLNPSQEELPATYAFRTHGHPAYEPRSGVLQILEIDRVNNQVQLKYRMVPSAKADHGDEYGARGDSE